MEVEKSAFEDLDLMVPGKIEPNVDEDENVSFPQCCRLMLPTMFLVSNLNRIFPCARFSEIFVDIFENRSATCCQSWFNSAMKTINVQSLCGI